MGPIIPVIIQSIKIDLGEGQEALSDPQEGLYELKKKMRVVSAWVYIVQWLRFYNRFGNKRLYHAL